MSIRENKLQFEIAKWLREQGCYVCKLNAGAGVPTGSPDLFFCKMGFYGFLEVKASENASKQPLQQDYVDKLDGWSYAKFVYPENWPEIKHDLSRRLKIKS